MPPLSSSRSERVRLIYSWSTPSKTSLCCHGDIRSLTGIRALLETRPRSAFLVAASRPAGAGDLQGCEVCSQHDGHVRRERSPRQPIPLPDGPRQRLMIDAIGPMRGPRTERYGVVLCDMYSSWPEVALCHDTTASTIISFSEAVLCRETLELVPDNGPALRSAEPGRYLS